MATIINVIQSWEASLLALLSPISSLLSPLSSLVPVKFLLQFSVWLMSQGPLSAPGSLKQNIKQRSAHHQVRARPRSQGGRGDRVLMLNSSKSLINYMGQLPSERSTHSSLNWETSGPIHILQVYLERDLHFQVVDVFVAMSVSHSMFDVLTLWQVSRVNGQKASSNCIDLIACALTTCLR